MLRQINFRAFVLCASAAIVFWLFQSLKQPYTTSINHPVSFMLEHTECTFKTPPPRSIALEIKGRGWDLLKYTLGINVHPVHMYFTPGENQSIMRISIRELKQRMVEGVPDGIEIKRVLLRRLVLHFARNAPSS